jgi:hypothetical protein
MCNTKFNLKKTRTHKKIIMLFFWVVTPCGLLGTYKHFTENILSPSSTPKIETEYFSETLVSTYKSTRRYNPEDQH